MASISGNFGTPTVVQVVFFVTSGSNFNNLTNKHACLLAYHLKYTIASHRHVADYGTKSGVFKVHLNSCGKILIISVYFHFYEGQVLQ